MSVAAEEGELNWRDLAVLILAILVNSPNKMPRQYLYLYSSRVALLKLSVTSIR
jgi:hypothetical protein